MIQLIYLKKKNTQPLTISLQRNLDTTLQAQKGTVKYTRLFITE